MSRIEQLAGVKTILEDNTEKILGKDEWLSLKQKNGYTYVHEEKSNGKGIAIIGFKRIGKDAWKFVGRYEETVPHGKGIKLASLTGQVENNDVINTAVKEFYEEAGIKIDKKELIDLGEADTYKAADTKHYLFAVDCKDHDIDKNPVGDGSEGEKGAYCEWIKPRDLAKSTDPLIHMLYVRGKNKGLFY